MPFLDRTFYGNSFPTWLIAIAVAIALLGALALLQEVAVRRAVALVRRRAADVDRAAVQPWVAVRWPCRRALTWACSSSWRTRALFWPRR